ncbi:AzlD domain-containing protein [Paracoccus sp. (in: a-proteobacteria)]|uniref:AzlD domain-containing protein n=1 Tax=Paracoccus sp. TaxID=267 RepID=UPI002AFE893E|nr:AzlD domain-containing protein [Paracoccus sp. (in: a-proteobacteria)]
MKPELLFLVAAVGLATWLFRFLPTKLRLKRGEDEGPLRGFIAATGPAAIATLFTASILPLLTAAEGAQVALVLGVAAVLAVYAWRRSVVMATLAGAFAYGLGLLV